MRFTILATCLMVGASIATAQQPAQKPSIKTKLMNTMNASVGGSDDCNTAVAINGYGNFAFDNSAASNGSDGQNEYACYFFGSSAMDNDVWFDWVAPLTENVIVQTCSNTSVDTKIASYPGGGCPTMGSNIACNDDFCGLQSSIQFSAVAGSSYMIQIACWPTAPGGTGTFDIGGVAPPSGNDDCGSSVAIAGYGSFAFDNSTATTGLDGQNEYACYFFGSSAVDNDVWFTWQAAVTETVKVQTCGGASTDTKIAAYPGTGCPAPGTVLACNDDACGLQSEIQFAAINGTNYTLQIGNYPGAFGGTGSFSISNIPPPSGNDDCNSSTAIAGQGPFNYDSSSATTGAEGQNESICYDFGSSAVDNDLWFDWTADATGFCTVSTCNNANYDTKLAAYDGTGCPSAPALACNDDATGCSGFTSEINFSVVAATTYILQVGSFPGTAGNTGTFTITIGGPPTPHPQDECGGAVAIAGSGTHNFDTTGTSTGSNSATTGTDGQNEPLCYAFGTSLVNNDIWYLWTADATGIADVTVCNGGATLDSKIAAWPSACPPVPGTILACNDDFCGLQSEIQFAATNGTSYMFQVGSFSAAGLGAGTFETIIAGAPGGPCTVYCSGDGSGSVACPCGNNASPGEGCLNGGGSGATLTCSGDPSVTPGLDTFVLNSTQLLPSQPCLFFQGNNAINGGDGITFGDGLRCAGGGVIRLQVRFPDASGNASTTVSISVKGGCIAGDLKRYQNWYRDPASSVCGATFNLTNAVEVTWTT